MLLVFDQLGTQALGPQPTGDQLERPGVAKVVLVVEREVRPRDSVHGLAASQPAQHALPKLHVPVELGDVSPEVFLFQDAPGSAVAAERELHAFGCDLNHLARKLGVVLDIRLPAAALDAVQRRLRDEHVPVQDQVAHLPEEEREQQRADVRTIHVRIGHQDDLVIAELLQIELVRDAGSQRRDHGADLLVGQHLVVAGLFDVQDLALQWQDRLIATITALLGGAARRLALDNEQFRVLRGALLAIGQLPRQARRVQGSLAPRQIAGLAGRLARPRRLDGLANDALRNVGIPFEVLAQVVIDGGDDLALDVAVQLALRLTLELGLRQLHADHRGQALPHVLSAQADFRVLEETGALGVRVDRARQGGTEAGQMRPPLDRVDRVGEREEVLLVAVVVLERDVAGHDAAIELPLVMEVDRVRMQRGLAPVQVSHELGDAALEMKLLRLPLVAVVGKHDLQPGVEKRHFAQAIRKNLVLERGGGEDIRIRAERDTGPGLARPARAVQAALRLAARILLFPREPVPPDLHLQLFGQRVHATHADSVQAAGHLVAVGIELAAGMQLGHHDLGRRDALGGVLVHRDAATVILDRDRVVDVDRDVDSVAVPGQSLVHGVIDDLVNQVVEAEFAGRADVHGRALPDSLQPFQHPDVVRGVVAALILSRYCHAWLLRTAFSPSRTH